MISKIIKRIEIHSDNPIEVALDKAIDTVQAIEGDEGYDGAFESAMALAATIADGELIAMAIRYDVAVSIAALLQMALKHPGLVATPAVAREGEKFTRNLIDSVIANSAPEHRAIIERSFQQAWENPDDLTVGDYELIYGKVTPYEN